MDRLMAFTVISTLKLIITGALPMGEQATRALKAYSQVATQTLWVWNSKMLRATSKIFKKTSLILKKNSK